MTTRLQNLRHRQLFSVANFRHGISLKPQMAHTGMSDLRGVYHAGVPQNSAEPWRSAAGGVGRDETSAQLAAIGEAVERYAGYVFPLSAKPRDSLARQQVIGAESFSLYAPEQRRMSDFPFPDLYADDAMMTNVFSLDDNSEHWVPHGIVSLQDVYGTGVSTSSGLAAGPSAESALLRGIQELIERDALMITWQHSVPGNQVKLPGSYRDEVTAMGGEVYCIDATPAYSPHPVALICGNLPVRGHKRFSLGAACRETWEQAVEKAYLEWTQGVFFAGYYYAQNPDLSFKNYDDVHTFDAHAVYYTVYPDQWNRIALLKGARDTEPHRGKRYATTAAALSALQKHLKKERIRIYYRELTTIDLKQVGVHVVRALSPDLAPIFSHQNLPYLGGTVSDVRRRYPWTDGMSLTFPNPMPHPLG